MFVTAIAIVKGSVECLIVLNVTVPSCVGTAKKCKQYDRNNDSFNMTNIHLPTNMLFCK